MDSLNSFLEEKRKDEYQIQHFEFCSSQFTQEVKEEIMSVIEEAATALERSLYPKYPSVDRDKIQLATRKLIERFSALTEEWGPSFQEKVDNIFLCIPSNVLLDEDKPQEVQYSREEVEEINHKMKELERNLLGLKYMRAKLLVNLKVAKRALQEQSEYMASRKRTVPSSRNLVKAVDKVVRKRRKYQEMEPCLLEGLSQQEELNMFKPKLISIITKGSDVQLDLKIDTNPLIL